MKLSFECSESWDDMAPTKGGRHCDKCDKTVIDVRGKNERTFNELRAAAPGEICIRSYADEHTRELLFMPRKRLPLIANAAFAVALVACGGSQPAEVTGEPPQHPQLQQQTPPQPMPPEVQGGIRPMEPPTPPPQPVPVLGQAPVEVMGDVAAPQATSPNATPPAPGHTR